MVDSGSIKSTPKVFFNNISSFNDNSSMEESDIV